MKTLQEQYKEEIDREIKLLHKRSKSDYQTLMRQVNTKAQRVQLNKFQAYAHLSQAKFRMFVCGRGAGKTTEYGDRYSRILQEMPRSVGTLICPTYNSALTDILPSLKRGLEMFGLYQDLHYFVGKQPPRSWRKSWGKAYQEPEKYDNYISFFNGVRVRIISQNLKNDGKGINSDWGGGDEAALLIEAMIQENIRPTIRGTHSTAFRNSSLWGSETYTSSMPVTQNGMWILDWKEKAKRNPEKYNFLGFSSRVNLHNLMPGYLEDAEANAKYRWMFEAEYLNIQPKISKDGFYALLHEDRHGYVPQDNNNEKSYLGKVWGDCRDDMDLVADKPLYLGIDWGSRINCLVVCQVSDDEKEIKVLKAFHVLGADQKTQDDLFENFLKYYRHHTRKTAYLFYDNTGNNRTGNTRRTRAEQAVHQFYQAGWIADPRTKGGTNPKHSEKHLLWENILKERPNEEKRLFPKFRVNMENAKDLYISMFHAKSKAGRNNEIKKDKSSEKKKGVEDKHATDYSDAMDAIIYTKWSYLLKYVN